ncbi:MFS transporter, putative metabolite:H+ symporter [Saccharopolyspora antimicrobica]|uniref:MFS transporter n=1 Tax=Saccharopolyspora antimicrobica TaxID=455193 RepID=A0A1I4VSL8_9PSEU|nr:MFS transporter [Saccharopolyspora antimicrobica]RKT87233.1 putative MFS transporter [Saccharopolyspora antimicrobica]SFN04049.1 MFS transporter, putative metabolite:H+ symporter [Saccharopolyspora antimicrobica]
MSVLEKRNDDTRTMSNLLLLFGTAIVLVSSSVGFVNAFTMDSSMPGMSMPMVRSSASDPLMGMPLSHMPEMFVAGAGLVIVLIGAVGRGRAAAKARGSSRGRILVGVIGTAALTIDISKTSTLGFVIPGMREEYGLAAGTASLLAVAGLSGTATGAVLFGIMSDRIGRRAAYLIATLGFTATSMCGTMPTFAGNIVMCALMGVAVGGLAPLLITLLTEAIGGRSRGSVVVALSVVATAVGYLVAAGSALWLEPVFGWRVLWLIGAPTGLVLVLLTPFIPDWSRERAPAPEVEASRPQHARTLTTGLQRAYALLIGVLTFGLTTWVPSLARAGGVPVGTANLLLTVAAVAMVPCALLFMLGYRRFGPVRVAVGLAGATAVLLLALTGSGAVSAAAWVSALALVAALFAVNTMAAVFLPIAADLADSTGRGRATGTVSLYNRLGGLCGPLLLAGLVSSASDVLVAVSVLALLCAGAAWYIGRRHRQANQNTPVSS